MRPMKLVLVIAAVALTAVAARSGEPAAAPSPFPCPDSLREGVDFWKKVWSTWRLDQVVLHDTDHPSIVYEVFELPPPAGDVYTDEQREYVKQRREALSKRLEAIEKKIAAGEPLEDDEKAVVLKVTSVAGTDGFHGASDRVRSQRGLRERFRRGLEISGRYHDEFAKIFRDAGLPEDLAYLPHVESSFQAAARSSAGAVGIWQFTRQAARKFMLMTSGLDERLDPVAAARGAARYLKSAYDEFGNWPLAITSYNHGIGGMRAAKERFGDDFEQVLAAYDGRSFGFASKNFYKEFLAAREIARDPSAYFPEGLERQSPLADDVVVLDRATAAPVLAARYGMPVSSLAKLNPAWTKRALSGRSSIPAGAHVWLPEGMLATIAHAGKTPRRPATKPLYAPLPSSPATSDGIVVHVVRKGETLFRIATDYGISLAKLLDANDLRLRATIYPGQELRIPK